MKSLESEGDLLDWERRKIKGKKSNWFPLGSLSLTSQSQDAMQQTI